MDDQKITNEEDQVYWASVPEEVIHAIESLDEITEYLSTISLKEFACTDDFKFVQWLQDKMDKISAIKRKLNLYIPNFPYIYMQVCKFDNTMRQMYWKGRQNVSKEEFDQMPVPNNAPQWMVLLAHYENTVDITYMVVVQPLSLDGNDVPAYPLFPCNLRKQKQANPEQG